MDQTLYNEFLKYIDSILRSDRILVIPDKARFIKERFYQFFEQPFYEENPTRTELEENRKEYIELYQPIKKLIQEFELERTNSYDTEGMKKETLEIMRSIEDDLNRAIKNIDLEIGKLQEDEQIKFSRESFSIAQISDKRSKRANKIAISAIFIAAFMSIGLFLLNFFLSKFNVI